MVYTEISPHKFLTNLRPYSARGPESLIGMAQSAHESGDIIRFLSDSIDDHPRSRSLCRISPHEPIEHLSPQLIMWPSASADSDVILSSRESNPVSVPVQLNVRSPLLTHSPHSFVLLPRGMSRLYSLIMRSWGLESLMYNV
jgi:hypothetical protein